MALTQIPDLAGIRNCFPALASGFVFLENAGGSQVPETVIEATRRHMSEYYVQTGAGYPISQKATRIDAEAHEFANALMNGTRTGSAILGPSTTQLVYMLAECFERALKPGDEIVIAETAHEANAGPWARLAAKGFPTKVWKVDRDSLECPLDGLRSLLSERTKIVALPHVSNLLGQVVDVKAITELCHSAGAKVIADGVAYAPHRRVDVEEWDVDFYVFSIYKVYGPHIAALYGKTEALSELTGPNHFFIPKDEIYKFELGGPSHEACAGVLGLRDYIQSLGGIESAYQLMTELELPLQKRLVSYLLSKPDVSIVGPRSFGFERVPTVSFVHKRLKSAEIAAEVDKHGIGIRHGHMYAYRLCQALGLDLDDGVVRVSAVHYNTVAEIDKLISVLDRLL